MSEGNEIQVNEKMKRKKRIYIFAKEEQESSHKIERCNTEKNTGEHQWKKERKKEKEERRKN